MSQPLVLVLIAILGITGTLGGVWLGSRLTQRNEDRKWRREHTLEAYSNFLRLVDATTHATMGKRRGGMMRDDSRMSKYA